MSACYVVMTMITHWPLGDTAVILKLEQLEPLRSEDTSRRLMITHTIESCWIPSKNKVE